MARFETFDRDIVAATAGLEQSAIAAALARFSREKLAEVIASGEGSKNYDKFVNGRAGAEEESVIPPGPIVYQFNWWAPIVRFALDTLEARSPHKSGRYGISHIVMVNGAVVTDYSTIAGNAEVTIVNIQPYARKIEVGHMRMSVPPGVYEAARGIIVREFGGRSGSLDVRVKMIQIPGGYILRGHFTKGVRKFARMGLRRDTAAGQKMTYPSLSLSMR